MDSESPRDSLFRSNGTTALETYTVIFPCVLLTFITTTASSFIVISSYEKRFLLDMFFLIVPFILNVTIFVPFINEIVFTLICVTICTLMIRQETNDRPTVKQSDSDGTKLNYITNARSTINVMSVIAILAVDFAVFPRRFTKTETMGYSLMDVGVGLFVYSNGIVAPEVHNKTSTLKDTLKSTVPLFILGSARFLLVKELDYHVPVSEYGVHWNFFMTLASVKILSSLVLKIISVQYAMVTALITLLVHEIGLQLGFADFVLNKTTDRSTFFKANREGIVSVTGYLGLYFISVAFGDLLGVRSKYHLKKRFKLGVKLFACSMIFLWATVLLDKNFGVSRRLANAGYCAWVMFIGVSMTSLYFAVEQVQVYIYKKSSVQQPTYVPFVFEAINYNGLAYFLLANVLTGLVNLSFDTMNLDATMGVVILVLYMFVNCAVICVFYCKSIKLKL